MEIIENEGDCLVTPNFVCHLGNEAFYAERRGLMCARIYVSPLGGESDEHGGVSVFLGRMITLTRLKMNKCGCIKRLRFI